EELRVESVAEHVEACGRHAEVAAYLDGARVRRGHDRVEVARHEALHADRMELDGADRLAERTIAAERRAAVDGQRMMDGREHRQAERAQPEQSPAEALHVVHDVVARAGAE